MEFFNFRLQDINIMGIKSTDNGSCDCFKIPKSNIMSFSKYDISLRQRKFEHNKRPNIQINDFSLTDNENESIIVYSLKDGAEFIQNISWEVKEKMKHREIFLNVFKGYGRVLRFKNKETNACYDLNVLSSEVRLQINAAIIEKYKIEFPKRTRIKRSSFITVNFISYELKKSTVNFKIAADPEEECPICYEKFNDTQVCFLHDDTHPVCVKCSVSIQKQSCPMCRKDFCLFDEY